MINKKGLVWIIISILLLGFIIGFPTPSITSFLIAFLIIFTSISMKEIASKYFFVDIEHSIWHFQRYGFYEKSKLKKPFPIGLVLPFVLTFISLGYVKLLTLLQFEGKPSKKRILKKRGAVRKSEVKDYDLAFISAWGLWGLVVLAIIGNILNFHELSKWAIYYGFWNLIPISQLDGCKLFFGSFFNWILLVMIYTIALFITALILLI